MSHWWQRPAFALLVVATVLLVTVAVAAQVAPATPGRADPGGPTRVVPVARAGAVCPDAVAGADSRTDVALAAPGAIDSRTGPGTADEPGAGGAVVLRDLGGGAVRTRLDAVGATTYPLPTTGAGAPPQGGTGEAEGVPLAATASGGLAPGFAASMTTRSTRDDLRGLAATPCTAPGTDFWFVGSGAEVGRRGRLYLSNPEPVPALVDVTLYGPSGPVDAPAGRGVSVAAGGQRVLKLDALAPDVVRFGVHVAVTQGRVAAGLRDQELSGLTPKGADWVPPTRAPARHLVVPGLLGGSGERRLQLVAPGDSDAIVRVRLVAADGSFVPSGLDVVEARAGRVTDVDLAPFTGQAPVAVELHADQPVAAGVLERVGGTGGRAAEMAYAAAAAPLSPAAPGVVPYLRGGDAGAAVSSSLLLAAPAGQATVEVRVLAPTHGTTQQVVVPAGSQVPLRASDLSDADTFAVVVVPLAGSGPVVAAVQVEEDAKDGPMVTSTPVYAPPYAVPVPRTVADLSTGLRSGG